ncbi:MAG: hypothetical protein M1821_009348 [Bathelium mastoideum]|nr:MAG: hypothetical protein M1821_009348 [Bathelium mastoideum]
MDHDIARDQIGSFGGIRGSYSPHHELARNIVKLRRQAYFARYGQYFQRASLILRQSFRPPFDKLDSDRDAPSALWTEIHDQLRRYQGLCSGAEANQIIPRDPYTVALLNSFRMIGISRPLIQHSIETYIQHDFKHLPLASFFTSNCSPIHLQLILFTDLIEIPAILPATQPREQALLYCIIRTLINTWFAMPNGSPPTSHWRNWQLTTDARTNATTLHQDDRHHVQQIARHATRLYLTMTVNNISRLAALKSHESPHAWQVCAKRKAVFDAILQRRRGERDPMEAARVHARDTCAWLAAEREARNERRTREAVEANRALESCVKGPTATIAKRRISGR